MNKIKEFFIVNALQNPKTTAIALAGMGFAAYTWINDPTKLGDKDIWFVFLGGVGFFFTPDAKKKP